MRQAYAHSIARELSGAASGFEADLHAAYDTLGIPTGSLTERMMTCTGLADADAALQETLTNGPEQVFVLPLLASLVPRALRGQYAPTYSRATVATVDDFEGVIRTVKSGEARFKGARRVENLSSASEDLSNGAWVKDGTSIAGTLVTCTGGNNRLYQINLTTSGHTYVTSFDVKKNVGSVITFNLINIQNSATSLNLDTGVLTVASPYVAGGATLQSDGSYRVWLRWVSNTSSAGVGYTGSAGNSFYLTKIQVENVTGQTYQGASEYVSNGPVPVVTLSSELLTNGDFANGTTGWSSYSSGSLSSSGGGMTIANGAASEGYGQFLGAPVATGKTYLVSLDCLSVSGATGSVTIGGTRVTLGGVGTAKTFVLTATNTSPLLLGTNSATLGASITVDNVSVKEITTNYTQGSLFGPELVTNGTFDVDASWTKAQPTSGSVTISGGVARINSIDGTYAGLTQFSPVVGKTYRVEFDVLSASGAGVCLLGGVGTNINSPGHQSVILTTVNTAVFEFKRNGGACDFTVDNVSVKEVLYHGANVDGVKYFDTLPDGSAIPLFGPELVTNGGFDADTNWTKHAGWSVTSGVGVGANTSGAIYQSGLSLTVGKSYLVTYTLAVTSGSITPVLGSFTGSPRTTSGAHSQILTPTSASGQVELWGIDFTGTVDNVSVKEVYPVLLGYLSEGQRTNLETYSQDFANAAWTKENSTISADAAVAPDGTMSADKLVDTTTAGVAHGVNKVSVVSASTVYVWSLYVKPAGRTKLQIVLNDNVLGGCGWPVDLTAGTISAGSTYGTAGYTGILQSIQAVANGWFRITVGVTTGAGTQLVRAVYLADAAGATAYAGDGASGAYIWQAQLEAASFASSYIPTTSAAVTRNGDVLIYQSSGNADIAQGTCFIETQVVSHDGLTSPMAVVFGDNATGRVLWDAGNTANMATFDGTSTVEKTGLSDLRAAARKRVATWGGASKKVTGDGLTPQSGTFDGAMGNANGIGVGCQPSGSNPWFGTIRNVRIWTRPLTDSRLQSLTS